MLWWIGLCFYHGRITDKHWNDRSRSTEKTIGVGFTLKPFLLKNVVNVTNNSKETMQNLLVERLK